MKIAFDNQTFCLQRYGGISRYFVELAKQFAIMGLENKIFAGFHQNNYLHMVQSQVVGKKVYYPKRGVGVILRVNNEINRILMNNWNPNVIHQTYYYSHKINKPTVLTVYDMIHEVYAHEMSPKDKTTFYKKRAVENADHIIAISHSTKQDLMTIFGVPEQKISVTHLGFLNDVSLVQKSSAILDYPYILYVGQRAGYKNFETLLKAYQQNQMICNHAKLVAFGGGGFTKAELEKIAKLGLTSKQVINLQGDDSLLINLYQNALMFVYPSKYEGFGIPPLEAMAQDCPVICSNTSSIPEVVGDSAMLFSPNDVDELSQKMQLFIENSAMTQQYIMLGRERIKQFSWQKCANETLSVYQGL